MPRRSISSKPILTWSANTELVGITLTLQPQADFQAPTQYTTELHSWFLNQVRYLDPELSAYLHDGQSEKAFTLSSLSGDIIAKGKSLYFSHDRTYQWSIMALSKDVCQWLQTWLSNPPKEIKLRSGQFIIQQWQVSLPAINYETVWKTAESENANSDSKPFDQFCLTFTTPTSFRKRGNHMPLPIPENVFHSYLRRWNNFAHLEFEQSDFLDWVNEYVVILRHDVRSQKTQAGKQGSVTGFVGAVQFGLTSKAKDEPEYVQLVHALMACAPYFGTGHKVTFGLGQTRTGWFVDRPPEVLPQEMPIAQTVSDQSDPLEPEETKFSEVARCANRASVRKPVKQSMVDRQVELKQFFFSRKKRQGGERAEKAADLWATIVVRQESGESLKEIATDLGFSYDTVKRYAKRAHQVLEGGEDL